MSEMGAKATGEYKGQSTGFAAKAGEAELRMAFQKIGGTATRKGQRFVSTEAAGVIAVSDISTGEDRSPAFSAGLSSGRISA